MQMFRDIFAFFFFITLKHDDVVCVHSLLRKAEQLMETLFKPQYAQVRYPNRTILFC